MSRSEPRPGGADRSRELWARRTPRWQLAAAAAVAIPLIALGCWVLGTFVGIALRELVR